MTTGPAEAAIPPQMESSSEFPNLQLNPQPITQTAIRPSSGAHLSFAQRKAQSSSSQPPQPIIEGGQNMRPIDRPPPGDVVSRKKRSQSKPELSRQRSDYFEDVFAVKESNPTKDRILRGSIIMAELKTNVEIADVRRFTTDLGFHLSIRYQRPMPSVVINVQHQPNMMFGGTFGDAYVLEVHALPSQLQPTTNKRNAALIQNYLQDALGVDQSRGLVRFIATAEENVARKGKTLAGEIEENKMTSGEKAAEFSGLPRPRTKTQGRSSIPSFGSFHPSAAAMASTAEEPTPPSSGGEGGRRMSAPLGSDLPQGKAVKRTKSFFAGLFGRS